jgi:hypothetical protein
MSQRAVERAIGSLATDEELRRRFAKDPQGALREMVARGLELNPCEHASLLTLDAAELSRFARTIDPRLRRIETPGAPRWNV